MTKLFVGYTTKLALKESECPVTVSGKNKSGAITIPFYAEKRAPFCYDASGLPHVGQLETILIMDVSQGETKSWSSESVKSAVTNPGACAASWFMHDYGKQFSDVGSPTVRFIGFGMRRFLNLLALECSLPGHDVRLPISLWTTSDYYYDIGELLHLHTYYDSPVLTSILRKRKPIGSDAWDKIVQDWRGPCLDPVNDLVVATELAVQIGL